MNRWKYVIPFWPLFNLWIMVFTHGGISSRRVLHFAGISFLLILSEPLRFMEWVFYSYAIHSTPLKEPPVFIIGHWRSGTSFLQDTLAMDPQFHYLSLYRMITAPYFLISEPWLFPFLNTIIKKLKLPYGFQRTTLNLSFSGEMDVALTFMGNHLAYTWAHLLPKKYQELILNSLKESHQTEWLEDYLFLMKKLQRQRPKAKIVVKSPGDTARIKAILRMFPEAKFINLHRDKNQTLHSTFYLWQQIQSNNAFQRVEETKIKKDIVWTMDYVTQKYMADKNMIPSNQLFELSFQDLHDFPTESLQKIYNQFGWGPLPKHVAEELHQKQGIHQVKDYTDPFTMV